MIVVNGDRVDFQSEETIASLLKRLGFVFPLLVVRVNGVLVERAQYGQTTIHDGDSVEIIHLMSGG